MVDFFISILGLCPLIILVLLVICTIQFSVIQDYKNKLHQRTIDIHNKTTDIDKSLSNIVTKLDALLTKQENGKDNYQLFKEIKLEIQTLINILTAMQTNSPTRNILKSRLFTGDDD